MLVLYSTEIIVNGANLISVVIGNEYNPDKETRIRCKQHRFKHPLNMQQAQAHAQVIKEFASSPQTGFQPKWFAQIQLDSKRFAFYEMDASNTFPVGIPQ